METRVLTAQIPLPLAQQIDEIATSMDRSRGWIVKQALTAWIDSEQTKHARTLQAMADVDAGRLIDDADVQAWAASLITPNPAKLPVAPKPHSPK